ncbi:MAG: aminotransferase class III-fold pyridoxal phosphate-dependent enzyme [Gammaproteobacteria bacterium]|nr:aminotransferase class III-fold pyridoxal phosphate-dependent enzyme [Gammaproteobacteria bacterium]
MAALQERERRTFARAHPQAAELMQQSERHWQGGVPFHWMRDWPMPYPVFVRSAVGATLHDVDGYAYDDFCLGDTGAMFGHSPPPVARALARQAAQGLTAMLPGERVAGTGTLLAARFGLPCWQMTQTATDANRSALRLARSVTGRSEVLVFDGCYHGTVDETLVCLVDGQPRARAGQRGPPGDAAAHTRVIDFNDLAALEAALADGRVAAVLCEPALTNMGMVLPQPGFHAALRRLTRRYGTLLVIDETHTLSAGPGGCTRRDGLEPDLFVCGKAIAGGMPCAVYGMSAELRARIEAMPANAEHGHSGLGTTLSANLLALAALEACLAEVMTDATFGHMETQALRLEQGLLELLARRSLPWHVQRIGARVELGFGPAPARNGRESAAAMLPELERTLHLYLLNRGVLLTPFHNMMLLSPQTAPAAVDRLLNHLEAALVELAR